LSSRYKAAFERVIAVQRFCRKDCRKLFRVEIAGIAHGEIVGI